MSICKAEIQKGKSSARAKQRSVKPECKLSLLRSPVRTIYELVFVREEKCR